MKVLIVLSMVMLKMRLKKTVIRLKMSLLTVSVLLL